MGKNWRCTSLLDGYPAVQLDNYTFKGNSGNASCWGSVLRHLRGKWYFEGTITGDTAGGLGIANLTASERRAFYSNNGTFYAWSVGSYSIDASAGFSVPAYGVPIGVMVDLDNLSMTYIVDGVYRNIYTASNFAGIKDAPVCAVAVDGGSTTQPTIFLNLGQKPFRWKMPVGFRPWNEPERKVDRKSLLTLPSVSRL